MSFITPTYESSSPYQWNTIRYTPTTLTGTVDEVIATLPAGTIILDAAIVCHRAQAGGTSCTVDVEVGATGAGDTNLLTGEVAVIATVENTVTEANLLTINAVSLAGNPLKVNLEQTWVGTGATAPIFEVHLLMGRLVQ